MANNLHEAYVHSLLSGGSAVRMKGGSVVSFQHGDGWFGDVARNLWGRAKSIFHKVKPHILSGAKEVATHVAHGALSHDGNLKERLKAGLQSGLSKGNEISKHHRANLLEHLKSQMQ